MMRLRVKLSVEIDRTIDEQEYPRKYSDEQIKELVANEALEAPLKLLCEPEAKLSVSYVDLPLEEETTELLDSIPGPTLEVEEQQLDMFGFETLQEGESK